MSAGEILIVDDEKKVRGILSEILQPNGFLSLEADGGSRAPDILNKEYGINSEGRNPR